MPHWFTRSIRGCLYRIGCFSRSYLRVTVGLSHTRRVKADAPVSHPSLIYYDVVEFNRYDRRFRDRVVHTTIFLLLISEECMLKGMGQRWIINTGQVSGSKAPSLLRQAPVSWKVPSKTRLRQRLCMPPLETLLARRSRNYFHCQRSTHRCLSAARRTTTAAMFPLYGAPVDDWSCSLSNLRDGGGRAHLGKVLPPPLLPQPLPTQDLPPAPMLSLPLLVLMLLLLLSPESPGSS